MVDPRVEKLADVLVNYSIGVKSGEWVLVRGDLEALPLINEVVRQVIRAGGQVTPLLSAGAFEETILKESSEEQLQWISPLEEILTKEITATIAVRATSNTRALTAIDPKKQRVSQLARSHIMQTFMQRAASGDLRWTLTQYPCAAYAQEADMSLSDYEDFVYKATFADQPDPVQAWQNIHNQQQKWVDWLAGKKQVVVRGPNVDLTLSIDGRTFINSDGKHNMPSGEIFTGPVEDSVNGWVRFSYPAISGGREVEGVEFQFENGKLVKASAKKNEEFLLSQISTDEGASYLGEFAIGTNYGITRFTKSILYDEKIGGTIHMALGSGYPETGSLNRSSIHWDFICDMRNDSEIWVDGDLLYQNGHFKI